MHNASSKRKITKVQHLIQKVTVSLVHSLVTTPGKSVSGVGVRHMRDPNVRQEMQTVIGAKTRDIMEKYVKVVEASMRSVAMNQISTILL